MVATAWIGMVIPIIERTQTYVEAVYYRQYSFSLWRIQGDEGVLILDINGI